MVRITQQLAQKSKGLVVYSLLLMTATLRNFNFDNTIANTSNLGHMEKLDQNTMEARNPPMWAREREQSSPIDHEQLSQQAIDVFFLSKQPNGEIGGIGWWQTANAFTAISIHEKYSTSCAKPYTAILADSLRSAESNNKDFKNEYNDDTVWWALCCLHVYELTKDDWFLERAKDIWRSLRKYRISRGQYAFAGSDMEGAVFWTTKADEEQINSITTGLYAELSVRLALIDKTSSSSNSVTSSEYIETARMSLGWILQCRYRKEDYVVLDNILLKQQRAQDWTFTYTTGVVIGVCALLYEATGEVEYLDLALEMAEKAMRRSDWVEQNGVLTERGAYGQRTHDPWQNNDAVGFKAILIRHLGYLYSIIQNHAEAARTAEHIRSFVSIQFQSQQDRNTNGNGQYGPWWNGPFECPTSHSQMAVLDVMAAAVLVNSI